jgi:ectoine hydroxylase-related dioxygenase (phytanoyl-CoA dioxygenase family)
LELSAPQLAQFDQDGYVVVEGCLRDEDLDPVIEEYDRYVGEKARTLHGEGRISQAYDAEPFERRLACMAAEDEETYRAADVFIDIMNFRGKATFDFLRNERLVQLIEGVLGPEIICSPIQHVRAKLPSDLARGRNSHVAPWHQDAQVHTEEADPHFILTVWIPLCDATPENGCLRIIPRVHRGETVYWSEGFGISEENMPEGEVLTVPMKKGSVLLLDKLTPHGSGPNATDGIRWSMDLRYQKAGTPTGRSCYPDFAVLSRADPSSVLTEFATWDRLWLEALEEYPQKVGRKTRPDGPAPQKVSGRSRPS